MTGRGPALAAIPLVLALLLAGRTVGRDSCTVDEFGNLPLTVAYWHTDALHIDPGNPPLTRWIQGIPLLRSPPELGATPAEIAATRTSWDLGYRFEAAHPDDYHSLLVRARRASVALLLLTVLGVFLWARRLAGNVPALGCALLTAASPNLLAHGRLVTPDIGLAAFVVWAGWATARYSDSPSLRRAFLVGALVALACLSKLSGLLLVPALLVPVVAAGGTLPVRALRAAVFGLTTLLLLYVGYGFPPPGSLLGIPTPLPAPFTLAIETQLAEAPYPAYLLGQLKEDGGGWWYYYLVAFLVKVPIPALVAFAIAAVVVARGRHRSLALPLLLAVAFFIAFGFVTKKNVGIRYLLPVLPLLHVVVAAALRGPGRSRLAAWLAVALAVGQGVGASAAPLAAFNGVERLLGGKRAVLVDSNLDWGQALPELHAWQEREGIGTVQLAYFGRVDPSRYGLQWRTLPSEPVEGAVAISATFSVGRPYAVLMKSRPFLEPSPAWSEANSWAWLRGIPPDEELGGGAILVWKNLSSSSWEEQP
ncbi:MAG: glycosyl transferase [Gemmatimonadota bacterium]|nr:MAG: glycosyl transferase [Gemmatimonadota bacterium]